MGRKLDAVQNGVNRSFNESINRLNTRSHQNDSYERGYAMALQDVMLMIQSFK
jgi:hypothetical protein